MGEVPAVPLTMCQSALEESFVLIGKDTAPNLPLYQRNFLYECLRLAIEFVELTVWIY